MTVKRADTSLFIRNVKAATPIFRRAFPVLDADDLAAKFGNFGHESNGMRTLQEVKPVVPGSRGGWGWPQWTGQRRRAFEAWADARGLDRAGFEANVGFIIHELKGPERAAIAALRRAKGLEAKTVAFERAYERAGKKHDDKRIRWARIARQAIAELDADGVVAAPAQPKPLARSRTAGGAGLAGAGGAAIVLNEAVVKPLQDSQEAWSGGTLIGVVLGLVILAGGALALYARWDDAGRPVPGWLARVLPKRWRRA
jgi:hypothetical protein